MEPLLYKINDAAKLLSFSRDTLMHWIAQGRIQALRYGKRSWRISSEEVRRLASKGLLEPEGWGNYISKVDKVQGRLAVRSHNARRDRRAWQS
jgi:excisionase family DNA binding protein